MVHPAPLPRDTRPIGWGDDVLEVLNSLKIERPVLVGHSVAGGELSSVGSRHPERVAGLVYLDAGYGYAFYDPAVGDLNLDLIDLQRKLEELQTRPDSGTRLLISELIDTLLPRFQKDLRNEKDFLSTLPPSMLAPGASTPKPGPS